MANLCRSFAFALFAWLGIFTACASAISMGTYQKSGPVSVPAGGVASTDLLFWSNGEERYGVELSALKVPPGWHVVAVPDKFEVGDVAQYARTENILIPGKDAFAAARVIPVAISVPAGEKEGAYEVVLSARAGNGTGEISLVQERLFSFHVFVKSEAGAGSSPPGSDAKSIGGDIPVLPGIAAENPEGQKAKGFGETEVRMALLLLLSAAIIYGAWRIYRRRR